MPIASVLAGAALPFLRAPIEGLARIPDDAAACRTAIAIQHMADTLNMKLCAKGIDNQDQFEFFEEIGIFKGQGPLIGSVMSMDELKEYLKRYAVKKGHA